LKTACNQNSGSLYGKIDIHLDENRKPKLGLNMSVQEFLDSLPSKGTKKVYKMGLKRFLEWYGKSAEEILEERKDDLPGLSLQPPISFHVMTIRKSY
jgi:predicted phosphoadenosine phosphosulfate sulfurtransferase